MGIQIAPMLGPMIGGMIIDTVGWREIFLVPIPICVVSLLLGMLYLPGREEQGPLPKFDWLGYSLLVAALASLLFAGANGQRYGWSSDAIVAMVLIGLAAGGAFVWLQLRSESPLLDFSLFRIPQFTCGGHRRVRLRLRQLRGQLPHPGRGPAGAGPHALPVRPAAGPRRSSS